MADTSPDRVRNVLGVSADDYPDTKIQYQIRAAEAFVEARIGDLIPEEELVNQITTLVAADLLYPRVSGEATGNQIARAEQGERSVEYAISRADRATGNSAHWQDALQLDYTGRLDQNKMSFYTLGGE